MGVGLFSGELQVGHKEEFLHGEGDQTSERAAQEVAESPCLEALKESLEVALSAGVRLTRSCSVKGWTRL